MPQLSDHVCITDFLSRVCSLKAVRSKHCTRDPFHNFLQRLTLLPWRNLFFFRRLPSASRHILPLVFFRVAPQLLFSCSVSRRLVLCFSILFLVKTVSSFGPSFGLCTKIEHLTQRHGNAAPGIHLHTATIVPLELLKKTLLNRALRGTAP